MIENPQDLFAVKTDKEVRLRLKERGFAYGATAIWLHGSQAYCVESWKDRRSNQTVFGARKNQPKLEVYTNYRSFHQTTSLDKKGHVLMQYCLDRSFEKKPTVEIKLCVNDRLLQHVEGEYPWFYRKILKDLTPLRIADAGEYLMDTGFRLRSFERKHDLRRKEFILGADSEFPQVAQTVSLSWCIRNPLSHGPSPYSVHLQTWVANIHQYLSLHHADVPDHSGRSSQISDTRWLHEFIDPRRSADSKRMLTLARS